MIGFVTSQVKAFKANEDVSLAQTYRGLPVFWLPGSYQIHSGPFAGDYFVPCDDEIMNAPLNGSPPLTPVELPEFNVIIGELGGLDARVDLPESDITAPDDPY